jgi:NAD(P)-dependent dehydrogenase (short-subunit alcohol dehydrogenase family)
MHASLSTDHPALVTGGTKGIGRAIAEALLAAGVPVVVTWSRDAEAAAAMQAHHPADRLLVVRSDVSQKAAINALAERIAAHWSAPVRFLVNNAGILQQGDVFQLPEEQWDRTLAVNLKGPFLLCQYLLPRMAGLEGASVVNISSIGGQTGGPLAPDYAASKAALICLTQSMARHGAKIGVRVNAVAPGWIDTGIFSPERARTIAEEARQKVPLGRLGTPAEVADSVLFLLSTSARYITGQTLNVNGGLHF